jgi:hypothetical protein
MLRSTSVLLLLLLAGCASTPTVAPTSRDRTSRQHLANLETLLVSSLDVASSGSATAVATPPPQPTLECADALTDLAPAPRLGALQGDRVWRKDNVTLKGGYYAAADDTVENGYIFNLSTQVFLDRWLALELEGGFFDAGGREGQVETDLIGFPMMVNGRATGRLGELDVYAGLGIGTIYYDGDVDDGSSSTELDGWLLAGNAFVGTSIHLSGMLLGLEAKYYLTDEISDSGEGLDALAVMLTMAWSW